MGEDYAIFVVNEEGSLEQLTTWLPLDESIKLLNSENYFGGSAKQILKKVRCDDEETR
tara:strand:+ start:298 stop:471 length:174 start_codon:yes stop_codon:yes gene_type:complete